jgi:serine/threonine protein kinase
VLVDFGLSGRHVRPGCAAGPYGAPELWGLTAPDKPLSPLPVDVYALGCVAFEVFTGQRLFEAPSEAGMIAAHLNHDGKPPKIAALAEDARSATVAEWLVSCLRKEPSERATIAVLQHGLSTLRSELESRPWPLAVPGFEPF